MFSRNGQGRRSHYVIEGLERRTLLSSVSGLVYADADNNGAYAAGDIPLPGRTVWVDLDNDGVKDAAEPSAVTSGLSGPNAPGYYRITGLANGATHNIRTVLPSSWQQRQPSNNAPRVVTFPAGPNNIDATGADFGTRNPATSGTFSQPGGFVFGDTNADGVRTSNELRLANQTVWIDFDDDGVLDLHEPQGGTTSSGGSFSIRPYNPGAEYTYRVRVVVPPQHSQTAPSTLYKDFTLGPQIGSLPADVFGLQPPGTLRGVAFHDLNGNGFQSTGEPGIAERTVYADLDEDGALDAGEPSVVTDTTGSFTLNVAPGTYQFRQVVPAGWTATTTEPQVIRLTSGSTFFQATFGSVDEIGEISGTVYTDANANGVRDTGENGSPFQEVFLDQNDNDLRDAGEPTATASVTGVYSFKRLPAGNYVVKMTGPITAPGTATHLVTLASDQVVIGRDFGRNTTTAGYFRGRFFNDADGDGRREPGDTPRAGQVVRVFRTQSIGSPEVLHATTTTDAGGRYGFGGLPADAHSYRIAADPIPGHLLVGSGLVGGAFSPGLGFANDEIGAYAGSVVRGTVRNDRDASGTNTSGDNLLAGWTVYHDANDNNTFDAGERSAVTGTLGDWSLGAPSSGLQTFRVNPPPGWHATNPTSGELAVNVATTPTFYNNRDFFFAGTVSGRLYDDKNANDAFDAGDSGFIGFRVYVDANQNGAFDAGEPSQLTGNDGTYAFAGLAAGTHRVRVDGTPYGVSLISPAAGFHDVTLAAAGDMSLNRDFRYRDITAPVVQSSAAGAVTAGATTQAYLVTFADDFAVDGTTLGLGDLRVTGPNGFTQLLSPTAADFAGPGALAVTYAFTPPGGSWDVADNGTYNVELLPGEIADIAGNTAAAAALTPFTVDLPAAPAPQVTQVFVAGTTWSTNFLNHLQASGQGESAFGFAIDPAAAPDELPWINLNKVSVRFSFAVDLTQSGLAITGVNVGAYATSAFAYDPVTFTATWTMTSAGVANDKLRLTLTGGSLAAPAGVRLNVLPGDANRSGGSVIGSDVTLVRNAQNSPPNGTGSPYTIFKDVNGSGSILGSDVTAVRNRQGLRLPADEPGTPSIVVQQSTAMPLATSAPPAKRRDDLLADGLAAAVKRG